MLPTAICTVYISLAWLDLPPRLCAVVGGRARASAAHAELGLGLCGSGRGSNHARLRLHMLPLLSCICQARQYSHIRRALGTSAQSCLTDSRLYLCKVWEKMALHLDKFSRYLSQ